MIKTTDKILTIMWCGFMCQLCHACHENITTSTNLPSVLPWRHQSANHLYPRIFPRCHRGATNRRITCIHESSLGVTVAPPIGGSLVSTNLPSISPWRHQSADHFYSRIFLDITVAPPIGGSLVFTNLPRYHRGATNRRILIDPLYNSSATQLSFMFSCKQTKAGNVMCTMQPARRTITTTMF